MTLIRLLLIALVIWLLLRMLKNWANKINLEHKDQAEGLETMVRCEHCGLHVPKNEAFESANKYYCSREHLRLHRHDPG